MAKKNLLEDILQSSEEASKFTDEDKVLAPLLDEINIIDDDEIKMFVRRILLAAPDAFWVAPGALEPEVHPLDEYTAHGLVLHTKRVVRCAGLLATSQGRQGIEIDILIAAALLHDVLKSDAQGYTDPMHAYTVDILLEEISIVDHLQTDSESEVMKSNINGVYENPETYMSIMRLIRCHHGASSIVPETIPVTTLEWLFANANEIAKNLHFLLHGPEVYVNKIEGDTSETTMVT